MARLCPLAGWGSGLLPFVFPPFAEPSKPDAPSFLDFASIFFAIWSHLQQKSKCEYNHIVTRYQPQQWGWKSAAHAGLSICLYIAWSTIYAERENKTRRLNRCQIWTWLLARPSCPPLSLPPTTTYPPVTHVSFKMTLKSVTKNMKLTLAVSWGSWHGGVAWMSDTSQQSRRCRRPPGQTGRTMAEILDNWTNVEAH